MGDYIHHDISNKAYRNQSVQVNKSNTISNPNINAIFQLIGSVNTLMI